MSFKFINKLLITLDLLKIFTEILAGQMLVFVGGWRVKLNFF